MALWNLPRQLWVFARKLDAVMSVHKRTEDSVAKILERRHALETRMTHLEADRGQMITEAKAAAGIAASAVAGTPGNAAARGAGAAETARDVSYATISPRCAAMGSKSRSAWSR
jgi:hypothetical protein